MRLANAAVVCLLLPAFLSAQDQPTIRVTTRLVQVNVLVHDKKGAPVPDLKKEDFSLFDRGKERKIAMFSVDSASAPPAWPTLPSNVFSNRALRPGAPTNVTVILFDVLNTKITDQMFARQQIIKFLNLIRPEDRVAIYLLGRDVRVLHDFTNDPRHLINALAKFKGRHSPEQAGSEPEQIAPSGDDDLDAFLQGASQSVSDFYDVNRALLTFDCMEAIAKHLSYLPGRKSLVWVSSSFPFTLGLTAEAFANPSREQRVFSTEAHRVGQAMNDSNIAIYPVDARGLVTSMSTPPNAVSNTQNARSGVPILAPPPNHDTMEILAERTGGRAYYNTNGLSDAIRRAIDDAQVTYTLGFYPPDDDWDEKFHDLKIKVDRNGVDARYRKGFVALSQQTPSSQEMSDLMKKTTASPVDARGIGINVRTDIVDKPKPGTIHLTALIDSDNLVLEQRNDRWAGVLELAFVQRATDGKVLEAVSQTLNMNLTRERYDAIRANSLKLEKSIQPLADADNLRFVVMDHATGNIGSLQIPLKQH